MELQKASPERKLELLNNETYWDAEMIYEMYPPGITWARSLVRKILKEMEAEGKETFKTKRKYVPKSRVLEKHPIDIKSLERHVAFQNKMKNKNA